MDVADLTEMCRAGEYVTLWIPVKRNTEHPRLLGNRGPRGRNVSDGIREDGKLMVVFESAKVLAFLESSGR